MKTIPGTSHFWLTSSRSGGQLRSSSSSSPETARENTMKIIGFKSKPFKNHIKYFHEISSMQITNMTDLLSSIYQEWRVKAKGRLQFLLMLACDKRDGVLYVGVQYSTLKKQFLVAQIKGCLDNFDPSHFSPFCFVHFFLAKAQKMTTDHQALFNVFNAKFLWVFTLSHTQKQISLDSVQTLSFILLDVEKIQNFIHMFFDRIPQRRDIASRSHTRQHL